MIEIDSIDKLYEKYASLPNNKKIIAYSQAYDKYQKLSIDEQQEFTKLLDKYIEKKSSQASSTFISKEIAEYDIAAINYYCKAIKSMLTAVMFAINDVDREKVLDLLRPYYVLSQIKSVEYLTHNPIHLFRINNEKDLFKLKEMGIDSQTVAFELNKDFDAHQDLKNEINRAYEFIKVSLDDFTNIQNPYSLDFEEIVSLLYFTIKEKFKISPATKENNSSLYSQQFSEASVKKLQGKGNKKLDFRLFDQLTFARNLKDSFKNNFTLVNWEFLDKLNIWDIDKTLDLLDNFNKLYDNFSSTEFDNNQSDYILLEEYNLKIPSNNFFASELYKAINKEQADDFYNNVFKEDTSRIAESRTAITNENGTQNLNIGLLIETDRKPNPGPVQPGLQFVYDNANYYMINICIEDYLSNDNKFEIQINLLPSTNINHRLQLLRLDNYIETGNHTNTGSVHLKTKTHLHSYNKFDRIRGKKKGQLDIEENWIEGIDTFDDALKIFLDKCQITRDFKKQIKTTILEIIDKYKNVEPSIEK